MHVAGQDHGSDAQRLRPAFRSRIWAEHPEQERLDGPVIDMEDKVDPPAPWALHEYGVACKLLPVMPQLMANQEREHPQVANFMHTIERAVFATLPIEGAIVGLAIGDSDRSSDNGIFSSDLHALSLEAPYFTPEPLGTVYVDTHATPPQRSPGLHTSWPRVWEGRAHRTAYSLPSYLPRKRSWVIRTLRRCSPSPQRN